MSRSICRIEYKNIDNVGGYEDAEFISDNFNENEDTHTFYISEESLKTLKKQKGLSKRNKESLKALTAEFKKHGEFDVSIF
jgi:hypothetical protein